MDGTWAEAPNWTARQSAAVAAIDAAGRAGRDVGFAVLTAPAPIQFAPTALIRPQAAAAQPMAWVPRRDGIQTLLADVDQGFETVWIAAPIQYPAQTEIAQALANAGPVTVIDMGDAAPAALRPARLGEGGSEITVPLIALPFSAPRRFTIQAEGQGPTGGGQVLEEVDVTLPTDAPEANARFDLPPELRNRINRFRIAGVRSAGAVSLTGTSLRRREVALIAPGAGQQEGLALLSQLHFVRQALVPSTDLLDATLAQVIQANPDAIILADVARIVEQRAVLDWIENGGILLRFAGPRLAAALFESDTDDPLLPVRLRAGGRTVGGAMSWGAPKTLQPFAPDSPFFGLPTPDEVQVTSQVLAEPGPDLADRVIARLTDGTPLVTQRRIGQGRVVLFHVTANTDWSNLPLSGLFVSMLERLSIPGSQGLATDPTLQGLSWTLTQELDAFGTLRPVADRTAVTGATLVAEPVSVDHPPGIYTGIYMGPEGQMLARPVIGADTTLAAPIWPAGIKVTKAGVGDSMNLAHLFLLAALCLLALDGLATLWLRGGLRPPAATVPIVAVAAMLLTLGSPDMAQADDAAIAATSEVVLAHVLTGDTGVDDTARAGLWGLSNTLFARTSVEPAAPVGVRLETDELAFFPFLYWPITLDQPLPNDAVRLKLNRYLRAGGMILFDTRDGHIAGFGQSTAEARKLRTIAGGLNIPPLVPIPDDHVLTRSFYLLQDFPGRHVGERPWVEAPPRTTDQTEGTPFRNLNDGVTPVIIGGNDWAAAWAMGADGRFLYPVGRGSVGDRQREIALRFGVNLIMHVLTGNYKSDQIHVPALLDRMGTK